MCIFLTWIVILFQRNTKLKKRGFHTERFSYIVLKKGTRDLEGQQWEKYLLRGGERSQDCDPLENVDLIIQNELIFDFDLCYLF